MAIFILGVSDWYSLTNDYMKMEGVEIPIFILFYFVLSSYLSYLISLPKQKSGKDFGNTNKELIVFPAFKNKQIIIFFTNIKIFLDWFITSYKSVSKCGLRLSDLAASS